MLEKEVLIDQLNAIKTVGHEVIHHVDFQLLICKNDGTEIPYHIIGVQPADAPRFVQATKSVIQALAMDVKFGEGIYELLAGLDTHEVFRTEEPEPKGAI